METIEPEIKARMVRIFAPAKVYQNMSAVRTLMAARKVLYNLTKDPGNGTRLQADATSADMQASISAHFHMHVVR